MRIIIIGAGPCGLGAAHRLAEQGFTDFAVYERNAYVGGLAASYLDDRGFTWDTAVHVAHSHYHYIDALMTNLLPDGYETHIRKSWVREYGTFVPYPFQYNIRHLPPAIRDECLNGLAAATAHPPASKPGNFREWVDASFGTGIARHFMIPYNQKIWRVDPSEMNCQWTGDRVPATDVQRVRRNIEQGLDDVSWGPNATFQFPRHGGTGAIWNALAARLPDGKLTLNKELARIDLRDRTVYFSDGTNDRFDRLVSTIPLPRLCRLAGLDDLATIADHLKYTHVYVVGVGATHPLPEHLRDKTWIYCPEDKCDFYRVTPFSLFSPSVVPDPERNCSLLVEFSAPGHRPISTEGLIEATTKGLRDIGLMCVDPRATHFHMITAEFGYPVPTLDRDTLLGRLLPALEERGLYSRGRFGGWKYEAANMDHSLMQGVEVADLLVKGTPEVTLPTPHLVNAGKR